MVKCKEPGCTKTATYGYESDMKALMCSPHKKVGMYDVRHPRCLHPGCRRNPTFGRSEDRKAVRCLEHKEPEMVDVINARCNHPGCSKQPTFGHPKDRKPTKCGVHREPEMVDVNSVKCKQLGCNKQPSFGQPGDAKCSFCADHKTDGMVLLRKGISCSYPGCEKRPYYAHPNEKKAHRCREHVEEGMILATKAKSNRCEHPDCTTFPSFAHPGELKKRRCNKHKELGMVAVRSARCDYPDCNINPTFGRPDDPKPTRCRTHVDPGMVDLVHSTCDYPQCTTRPNFGYAEDGVVRRCKKHIEAGMVSLDRKCDYPGCSVRPSFAMPNEKIARRCRSHIEPGMEDIKHRKCIHPGCSSRANYGRLFSNKTHCAKHRLGNEFARNNPMCFHTGCLTKPSCSAPGNNYPVRCTEHSLVGDTNIMEKPCSNCHLPCFINDSSAMCDDCTAFGLERVRKSKEIHVKTVFDSNGLTYMSHDSIVVDGCTRYRPDFIFDKGTYYIIVEVDENQHKSYACECEQVRMLMLWQDLGGVPTIFIRYNPDEYVDATGALIKDTARRDIRLVELIRSFDHLETLSHPLMVTYMYYDGYNGHNEFLAATVHENTVVLVDPSMVATA